MKGNLGRSVMKVSAVAEEHRVIEAPARVFHDQDSVKSAFKAGELTEDVVIVVRFQGPKSNGMPELHGLTPALSVLQSRGIKTALVTDGRMSGASGKVPAAIHLSPEAADGGPIARIQGRRHPARRRGRGHARRAGTEDFDSRAPVTADLSANETGLGRELFAAFRQNCCPASDGGALVV